MASLTVYTSPWLTMTLPRRFKKLAMVFEGSVGALKDKSSSRKNRTFVSLSILKTEIVFAPFFDLTTFGFSSA